MTRFEEKLYLQSVFDAIDQVYKMKKPQEISSYEERLRASFNKLIIPDWYNHEHTTTNGLRKTKSHGHVPRIKRINYNDNNDDTPDTSVSSSTHSPHLSNGKHRQSYRHRSPSRSWSERPPLRHDSTTSSYDTNGSVINGRRSIISNGSASYAPGVQRVAQSSTWYKPRIFTPKITNGNTNGHSIEPPKPLPRYSKIDQERIYSLDSSSPSSSLKIENVRLPIKPRTMAQAQIPLEESFVDVTSDADVTLIQESPIIQTTETSLPRTNSLKSISSEAESYRSAILPPNDKNLLATDSSSYASVNERCLSPSTASYHTAIAGDTSSSSSITGYETPTPQLDDDNTTLSSHSSLSDLSHAETLEPNTDDLDITAILTAEQKSDSGMEKSSLITSNMENTNWYDGSLETCIQQTVPNHTESLEIREIPNDEILREIDINAVGDEFFLFSPRNTTDDDELSNSTNTNKEILESPTQTFKRIFTLEEKNSNDPFDFDNNNSTIMITNLDDILIDDDDDDSDYSSNNLLNTNYRRPIQEDILYEVEHENSFSDNSQNTSSIIPSDDKTSIKLDANIDYLTTTDSPVIDNIQQTSTNQNKKQTLTTTTTTTTDNNTLPIYILPPLYTTTPLTTLDEPSSSLNIDTNNNFQKWDSFIHQFSDLTSPSAYTSKIRHRHYSVGSYYDNKTTTVTINPNNTSFYFLGSAPVSPLSRGSTTSNDSHYHIHRHHSPITYDNVSSNALRRVNPFFESNNNSKQSTDYRSSSLNREENSYLVTYISPKMTSKSVERTIPIIQTEQTPVIPNPITSPPSTRTSFVTFPQYEIPTVHSKPIHEIPTTTHRPLLEQTSSFIFEKSSTLPSRPLIEQNSSFIHEKSPPLPPRSTQIEPEPPLVRSKINREQVRSPPVTTRIKSMEKEHTQNIYQEIDSTSTDEDQSPTRNADLQFIRGAIDRVFHFNGESTTDTTSESGTYYEEVQDENLTQSKKLSTQYPAVEAFQRFYNHKPFYPTEQVTNLDDIVLTNSLISKKSRTYSPPNITQKKTRSKSSEHEQISSEEIDDTLNDIEDVDYPEDKYKRQIIHNHSTHTSNENSPLNSSDTQTKSKKISQETQTIERQKPMIRTTVPPIDIVTDMVIEQDDDDDNNRHIDDVDGDMVIFYDDIEIVEHSTSSCSSESDSTSSTSHHYSKPINTSINQPPPPPPPVPARTLKPIHLLNNNHRQSPTTINKTYELDKSLIRKRFDVNSVNDMLNRTEYNIGPSVTHRHPSARHFVGKLNSEDLPLQTNITNGYKQTPTKTLLANLPTRPTTINRSIIADTNALVKHIQNSLSRNSLHDTQINSKNLSTSTKDLRAFVSSTYSPSDENTIDDNGMIHIRPQINNHDDQTFKRQARLSKSFHNVSEYNSTDQYPKKENQTQPSKSVENNLNEFPQNQTKIPLNLTSVVTSTSFSALPNSDDHARMLSMKWYTGQVNENSEICYNAQHIPGDDLLYGYVSTHSNREIQDLLARLQASNDPRINAALDDIRSRVAQFDASKSREDLHVFMRYLESRLRDLSNKKSLNEHQELDTTSIKSRANSGVNNKNIPQTRQLGRQQLRSSGSIGDETNGQQPIPPRRTSQSSANQENPAVFDEMLNTVLGLPKKGVSALPQTYPGKREKPPPLVPTQITTNTSTERDIGKRLFESGTYKDPRLIYDGPKKKEKEEQPLETSV